MAEMTCDAIVCRSRLHPAAEGHQLEQIPRLTDKPLISARLHRTPFELSLDTAVAADIVIGDYQLRFRPVSAPATIRLRSASIT